MERLVYYLYRALLRLIQSLPIEVAWRFGYALGFLGRFFAPGYTLLARRNLYLAFGEELSPAERRRISHKCLELTLANLFAGICAAGLSDEDLRARITYDNQEVLNPFHEREDEGMIIAIAHMAAWELYSAGDLVSGPKRGTFLYQRIRNTLIDAHFRKVRSIRGLTPLDRQTEIREAPRNLREGGALGILVDQHAGDQGVWLPFFNRLASTSPIPGSFAKRTGSNVIFAGLRTTGPARWNIRVIPVAEPGHNLSEDQINLRVQQALESCIREKPEDWFWVHNRWKTPNPNFLVAKYRRGTVDPALFEREPRKFRMLIRSPNWLGDAVMAVPAVRAFKAGRMDAHVTVLCPEKLAAVWDQEPAVDEVLKIPKDGSSIRQVARLIRKHGPFQAGILLPNSLRTALEMRLGGVWRRVGYPGHSRRKLLDQVAPEPDGAEAPPMHHALRYLHLARVCGADLPAAPDPVTLLGDPSPQTPPAPAAGPVRIGVCPGAEYGPAKRWFPEHFAETIRLVHAEHPEIEWVLFGVAGDQPQGDAILRDLRGEQVGVGNTEPKNTQDHDHDHDHDQDQDHDHDHDHEGFSRPVCEARVIDRIGETSLTELMDDLRECRLLLTNDTGTMHLSAFLGTPVVAIFGSTEPPLTGPLGPGHKILRHHVPCSPCFLRECVFQMECMKGVTPEAAAQAILQTLHPTRETGDS